MTAVHFEFRQPLSVSEIDLQQKIIKGVTVMTGGVEAKGHGLHVDGTTIEQVVELGRKAGKIQVKYNHRSGVEDIAGYLFNFRKIGHRAVADWQLLAHHEETSKTLEKAEKMPECFGLSAAFNGPEKGERIGGSYYARLTSLESVDCVPNPAANPTGLFSAAERQSDLRSAASMGISAGITTGGVSAILGLARRRAKLIPVLKSAGKLAGAVAAGGAGSVLIANKLIGSPTNDEVAPFTKRGAIGGAIGGALVGAAAPLLARKVPWVQSRLEKAAATWRPAKLIRELPTSISAPLAAATGSVAGAAILSDEGQQVDTLRNIRRQNLLRRDFADMRPRNGAGQFAPASGGELTPELAKAAYKSDAASLEQKKAFLDRFRPPYRPQRLSGRISTQVSPAADGGPQGTTAMPDRIRAARFMYADRLVNSR